ncbi:hypothetical protein WJX84_001888 [Apatococcus fuscideae]|uniref:Uncharacterized protein n=1 Tax=Apatococcus fuscideae TaxID=2026836 RepID=A0AAW1SN99_9CHLO
MFGRRTPTGQQGTDTSGRVSPRTTGTGLGGGVGTGQQYGQSTTGSSPRYAQQTTTTAGGYSGTGTGTGYSGPTGTGKVLSSSTDRGLAEFPGIGGSLAPIQHSERYPLAASERQYGGVVCNRQYFTVTEDRTVLREEIQLVREHHPYEKEFVVESRPTGRERELPNTQPVDLLESTLREVEPLHP